jgi:hypothetical protein
VITGIITSNTNQPLANANIIAKPLQENESLKFCIANAKGEYKLGLEKNVSYELRLAYLGYVEQVLKIVPSDGITQHNFVLLQLDSKIETIVIKYDYKPIEIKKDTATFDVKAFADGTERKMGEVLSKMPGFEVSKNGQVEFQGKPVNQLTVGGKPFFGGGTKLGVQNIPADALDKIEMIDNFNEVGFMKQVSGSDQLALNVVLKKDKQNFVFGDVDAGYGNNNFYLLHAALFKYNPKTNINFIGDLNNTGKKTLDYEDMSRLGGGYNLYNPDRPNLTNFFAFNSDNKEVLENKNQFGALNYQRDITKNTSIDAFVLFSKNNTLGFSETKNLYLNNNLVTPEDKTNTNNQNNYYGLVNAKLKYNAGKTSRWFYNMQYQLGNTENGNQIVSVRNSNTSLFDNNSNNQNYSFKQFVEWNKQYNKKSSNALVLNNQITQETPNINWQITNPQLSSLIPLQTDLLYNINQTKKINNLAADLFFKYYYILNSRNHFYFKVGNNLTSSKLLINEFQQLSNNTQNNFNSADFGNNITYNLNDFYLGTEYKFMYGNFTTTPIFNLHFYNLNTKQTNGNYSLNKTLFEPELKTEYTIEENEKITLNYKLTNRFPEAAKLSDRYTLSSYNTVFRGNALLQNEIFHAINLRYNKNTSYNGNNLWASVNYSQKTKTIRNEVNFSGINQFSTPILTNNPETTWRAYGNFSKKIKKIKLNVNASANWFNYIQKINNIETNSSRNSQTLGGGLTFSKKKWPYISIDYDKTFNQFKGLTNSDFFQEKVTIDFDVDILKHFIFKTDFEAVFNTNGNQKSNFKTANASLRYHKKDSPFGYEISVQNYLNNEVIIDNSFSDFLISNTTTFVLPRIFMFTLSYKL